MLRINREISKIKKEVGSDTIVNLQNIFGLDKAKFNISLEPLNNQKYIVSIKYTSNQNLLIDLLMKHFKLPLDVNNLISEYLLPTIRLKFEMEYLHDYPFNGISWRLIYCDNEFSNLKKIYKYYSYIAEEHTKYNLSHWSPAMTTSTDILTFITRLKFEELVSL